ncbi:carbohydrate-binding module family 20 protein, partial [Atractiella rhizophila]
MLLRNIFLKFLTASSLFSLSFSLSIPEQNQHEKGPLVERQTGARAVFAHFMVGIVAAYDQSHWEADCRAAKAIGIDAFALNIGKDDYNDKQLGFAYAAGEVTGFKMFISFDFVYWNSGDSATIASYLRTYGNKAAAYKYNNAVFVSTFIGDNAVDWNSIGSQAGLTLYACPNWQPGSLGNVQCGFSWDAWPSSNNQPINSNKTTATDVAYKNTGKPYMMPVSPWFYTHYGADTYNKNWIFYSDWLWNTRWDQVLSVGPQFVEIITWNDFGESHYIGPLHPDLPQVYAPNGQDNGAKKWVTDMPHDGWQDVAKPYITAFKNGASAPTVSTEEIVYYYRTSPKSAACNDAVGRPTGADFDADEVFATVLVTATSNIVITSGSNTVTRTVSAGIHTVSGPMGVGTQSFQVQRNGVNVLSGTSPKQITSTCQNSAQPYNAYVGTIKSNGGTTPPTGGTATIIFNVVATTVFGENIFLTGSIAELSSWDPWTAVGPL